MLLYNNNFHLLNINFLSGVAAVLSTFQKKKFPCIVCGKVFTTKFRMQTHMEIHSESRNLYQCPQCSRNFTWKDNLQRHLKTLHFITEATLNISVCDENSFSNVIQEK